MLSEETSFLKCAFQNYPCKTKMVGSFAHYLRSSVFRFTSWMEICDWKMCQNWSGSWSLHTGIKLFDFVCLITVLFSYCFSEEGRDSVYCYVIICQKVLREQCFLALKSVPIGFQELKGCELKMENEKVENCRSKHKWRPIETGWN